MDTNRARFFLPLPFLRFSPLTRTHMLCVSLPKTRAHLYTHTHTHIYYLWKWRGPADDNLEQCGHVDATSGSPWHECHDEHRPSTQFITPPPETKPTLLQNRLVYYYSNSSLPDASCAEKLVACYGARPRATATSRRLWHHWLKAWAVLPLRDIPGKGNRLQVNVSVAPSIVWGTLSRINTHYLTALMTIAVEWLTVRKHHHRWLIFCHTADAVKYPNIMNENFNVFVYHGNNFYYCLLCTLLINTFCKSFSRVRAFLILVSTVSTQNILVLSWYPWMLSFCPITFFMYILFPVRLLLFFSGKPTIFTGCKPEGMLLVYISQSASIKFSTLDRIAIWWETFFFPFAEMCEAKFDIFDIFLRFIRMKKNAQIRKGKLSNQSCNTAQQCPRPRSSRHVYQSEM